MVKAATRYVCQTCGAVTAKWSGRCEACGEWNSIVEEAAPIAVTPAARSSKGGGRIELVGLEGESAAPPRLTTGNAEFDRVCGGGLVPGSAVLIGGDPGIGKSTLLLQVCAAVAQGGAKAIYISGEEGVDQVRLRAERLGLAKAQVQLAAAAQLKDILAALETVTAGRLPSIVVIDSIQTMWLDGLESAPGTVAQVRASAQELVSFAKRRNVAVLLVGHVTKDGQIAGPRVVEHMVDAVLYFEGDRSHHFRILRGVKNRFGPTDEIGVFEMTGGGLEQVANPSALFLGERSARAPGVSVFAGIEGTRPVLVEIQALVAPTPFATPRRAVVGWDSGRLAMVLAVLDAHCDLSFAGHDVYLNVAGGLRINEPAADLAAAGALVSSLLGLALPSQAVLFGEVSLSGLIRPVALSDARRNEARKLGFSACWMPADRHRQTEDAASETTGLRCTVLEDVAALVEEIRNSPEAPDMPGAAVSGRPV